MCLTHIFSEKGEQMKKEVSEQSEDGGFSAQKNN
jgi:hypothetical protein